MYFSDFFSFSFCKGRRVTLESGYVHAWDGFRMIALDEQPRSWIRRHYENLADLRKDLHSTGRPAGDSRFRERLDLAIRQLRYASALHHDKALFVAANSWLSRLSRVQEQTDAWRDEDWALWLDQVIRFVETRETETADGDAPQARAESKRLPKVLVIGSQRLFDLLNGDDTPSGAGGEPGYVLDYADWNEWETAIHQELIVDRQTAVLLHARPGAGDLSGLIRHIRETGALVHLPVAVVAEDMDPQRLAELYESPADLVLPGPVDARILHAAIRRLLGGLARDAGRTLAEDREQLIRLVTKEWQRYIRFQSPFAVVYVSLEQYPYLLQRLGAKQVNEIVHRMFELSRGSIRTSDEIRRWKANAFVLLLPMANKEGGQLVAQRILAKFSRELESSPLYPYMRIGVSEGERGYERAEDIIRRLERQVVGHSPGRKQRIFFLPPMQADILPPGGGVYVFVPSEHDLQYCSGPAGRRGRFHRKAVFRGGGGGADAHALEPAREH
jgi:GGDEF domain-containing protein